MFLLFQLKNKDELALEAIDYAVNVLRKRFSHAVRDKESAYDKLVSTISIYENVIEEPPLLGGCPVLNTAIDSDDTHPALQEKSRLAMDEWLAFIRSILLDGIYSGEFRADLDLDSISIFITSSFEGSVMMAKLYHDSDYVRKNLRQLTAYLQKLLVQ